MHVDTKQMSEAKMQSEDLLSFPPVLPSGARSLC